MAKDSKKQRIVTEKTIRLRLKTKIKNEFLKHIQLNSSINIVDYNNWYCGITKHPQKRILQHINKRQTLALYPLIRDARSTENAHEIEKVMSEIGTINSATKGGATKESRYVYIFKDTITPLDLLNEFLTFLNS